MGNLYEETYTCRKLPDWKNKMVTCQIKKEKNVNKN